MISEKFFEELSELVDLFQEFTLRDGASYVATIFVVGVWA